MEIFDRKSHWDKVYRTKGLKEVSWYQKNPETSLKLIRESGFDKDAKIIDVGGGNSLLTDYLLKEGYTNITVLDISETAINNVKERLGDDAGKVKWIVSDIADFYPNEQFEIWHDRAAFHFLTETDEIKNYIKTAEDGIKPGGRFILGTFSENGPGKCSGIPIKQYSEKEMISLFQGSFEGPECLTIDHKTPAGKIQNFTFCRFIRTSL